MQFEKKKMHDYDCEIRGHWVRGSDPKVGSNEHIVKLHQILLNLYVWF